MADDIAERAKRRDGHSRLVYNKTTRTIDTVDPHPPSPTASLVERLNAWASLVNENVTVPLPVSDEFRAEHREKGALLTEAATAILALEAERKRQRGTIEIALASLKAMLALVKEQPELQGRQYIDLGIQVHQAIRCAEIALATPATLSSPEKKHGQ